MQHNETALNAYISMSLRDIEMLQEQLTREPFPLPKLIIDPRVPEFAVTGKYEPEWLEKVEPGDFVLEGYRHHPPLTAAMAV